MMIYMLRIVVELRVELRGFEPHREAGEIACELRWMFDGGVTRHVGVLRICVAVLRDVTVLAYGQMPGADRMSDLPPFRRRRSQVEDVYAGQIGRTRPIPTVQSTQSEPHGGCRADKNQPPHCQEPAESLNRHDAAVSAVWGRWLRERLSSRLSSRLWSVKLRHGRLPARRLSPPDSSSCAIVLKSRRHLPLRRWPPRSQSRSARLPAH